MRKNFLSGLKAILHINHYERALARATNLSDSGKVEEAISLYQDAVSLQPDSSEARIGLASAYFETARKNEQTGDLKEASKNYKLAVRYDESKNPEYLFSAAGALSLIGDYAGSLGMYDTLIDMDGRKVEYFLARANEHEALNDYRSAISDLSEAIALNPVTEEFYLLRKSLYERIRLNDLAKKDRVQAAQLRENKDRKNTQHKIGDYVKHNKFGQGTVRELGPDGWVFIDFVRSDNSRWMSENIAYRLNQITELESSLSSLSSFDNPSDLNWEILPPGWWRDQKIVSLMRSSSRGEGDGDHLVERLQYVDSFNPTSVYRSKFGELGYQYYIFVFKRYAVAECPDYGNAIYVLDGVSDWKAVFRHSRGDVRRFYRNRIIRIYHTDNWKGRLARIIS